MLDNVLELGPKICLRAILDKGPWTKSLGTNLKQIEPWIGPFFTLKKTLFLKGTMSVSKTWGLIWRPNIKNVWLTCEKIKLTFGLFSFPFLSWLIFFFVFQPITFYPPSNSPPFHALRKAGNALLLATTL